MARLAAKPLRGLAEFTGPRRPSWFDKLTMRSPVSSAHYAPELGGPHPEPAEGRGPAPINGCKRLIRGFVSLVAALFALATPAFAGDRAEIALIGFSDDGRYFAYEEYGIQDGSGYAFSSIYAIDLTTDRWMPGTPFKARAEDEDTPLAAIRAKAATLAKGPLDELQLGTPAIFTALNGDGEPMDGQSLAFGTPGYGLSPVNDTRVLTLETFPLAAPADCASYTDEPLLGFAVAASGQEFHRDTAIPKSRNCPLAYRIYGMAEPAGFGYAAGGRAAIISVYSFGFEGPDRRFIAVPIPNP